MDFEIGIIGAGAAGLTAAIYGARAGMSVAVFDQAMSGGQPINTPTISAVVIADAVRSPRTSCALPFNSQRQRSPAPKASGAPPCSADHLALLTTASRSVSDIHGGMS